MIDKFQRLSRAMQFLRIPSIVLGLVCLVLVVVAILNGGSTEGHPYVMPGFVGLVWAIATFSFISTFSDIPSKPGQSDKFLAMLKRRLSRAWYWVLAVFFLVTSVSALLLTGRLISIWLRGRGN
jgi:hypothetical protein